MNKYKNTKPEFPLKSFDGSRYYVWISAMFLIAVYFLLGSYPMLNFWEAKAVILLLLLLPMIWGFRRISTCSYEIFPDRILYEKFRWHGFSMESRKKSLVLDQKDYLLIKKAWISNDAYRYGAYLYIDKLPMKSRFISLAQFLTMRDAYEYSRQFVEKGNVDKILKIDGDLKGELPQISGKDFEIKEIY